MITNGAYFLAKVFHEAYHKAARDEHRHPASGWDNISRVERRVAASAMQKLIDLDVVQPISLHGVRRLRAAGWNSATPVRSLEDPLEGANCTLCGATADNFHVSDALWELVGLGHVQACFKCFRIAAWHAGIRPDPGWQVGL